MRMGQQYRIDVRKIAKQDAGPALTPQKDQPCGENGIDEHGLPTGLNQKRRVADERNRRVPRHERRRDFRLANEWLGVAFTNETPKLFQFAAAGYSH